MSQNGYCTSDVAHSLLEKLHSVFRGPYWKEIRVDIDPAVKPDIQASITDLRQHVTDASIDAVWSSHNIEHLYDHEVVPALREFVRVLRPAGFALITCPDLQAIAKLIAAGVDRVAYQSPAGPVTPLDMLFGLRRAIERGNLFMCHRTGFTEERLGNVLLRQVSMRHVSSTATTMICGRLVLCPTPTATRSRLC